MSYSATVKGRHFGFHDLKTLLAKASPRRAADEMAGLAAASELERAIAQQVLADLPLQTFLDQPLIDPELDEVSALIYQQHDSIAFAPFKNMSVGEFRDWLLADTSDLAQIKWAIIPEMAAAVSKIMRNQDLIAVARRCRVVTRFRSTLGLPGRLSSRLQPNHPTDDPRGIAASTLDGLLYGSGDAVIGINPATDNLDNVATLLNLLDEIIDRHQIPSQSCVLSHVTTSMTLMQRGAPVDLVFQSIAGTAAANRSFGIDLSLLREAKAMASDLRRNPHTDHVMYFETGQGSALSANAHHGIDAQTCEARAYAVAREFSPLLVNTVVGFIGPEYLYDGKQIIRAGLEDHFCGKLLGLPMGCDVCYTNHAEADQNDMDNLLTLLGVAGCNFIMGIPGADDVMLAYQSTSFHDCLYLRQVLGLLPAPEFAAWLDQMGIFNGANALADQSRHIPLLAQFRGLTGRES
ncbi:ethanolamine ammonia-lyase subunit EutB [Methylomonas paludis]|uniref:Ethanolamine ammonia-lyase large subunit n=1 Tax=Methylomonas paludis TaxID=1173101 RepID=A0A975MLW3_9GAMM|nr:ethanolamine ammonia-lyase subunit EutB [Methylomonas paludis]QWF69731.1 ethanolamine ammonia-lyase subunit EutB [Methylomonas paludis]